MTRLAKFINELGGVRAASKIIKVTPRAIEYWLRDGMVARTDLIFQCVAIARERNIPLRPADFYANAEHVLATRGRNGRRNA